MDATLDHAPCGFLTFADDGIVGAVNSTLLGMLGYARDEVVGRHLEHLLNVGSRIFYQTHWFPLLRLHGHAEEVFLILRAKDGSSVGVLSYAVARNGGYDVVVVHVRERAKYEDELLRAKRAAEDSNAELHAQQEELEAQQEELEAQTLELELQQQEAERLRIVADEANQAKSAFLATMSHELRTPLNAISGYLQILQLEIPGPLTPAQHDIISRVEQSGRHLLRLINEVLNLARIEAGHVDYRIERVAVSRLVSEIRPMIEPQCAAKSIQFRVEHEPTLEVNADVEKAVQVLLNLLSNAVKFTPAGGLVTLRARRAGSMIDISVEDSGIGIPKDRLDAVFEPFVQVDSSHTRTSEGTGLGLAISRDLAHGMGGSLAAVSEPGVGSTFTFTLPFPDGQG